MRKRDRPRIKTTRRKAEEAAAALEGESTDAGKADASTEAVEVAKGVVVEVRIRRLVEPVLQATCRHCENPFWFKKSHGYRTHDGKYASWRVECGWCSKPQYLPVDEHDIIVDEFIPSKPTKRDLM